MGIYSRYIQSGDTYIYINIHSLFQKIEIWDSMRYLYNHVHSRIIQNSQKMEATHVSTDR